MRYLSFWISLFALVLFSCSGKSKQQDNPKDVVSASPSIEETKSSENEVKFPVYNFDSFEPLLHKEDNTIYVVNFWATWCKPCIEELPYFEKVNAEFKDDNVKVVLVSLDMPSMWKSRLEPFVEKKGLQSEVVILDDPKQNTWIPKVSEEWGGGIPATLIYNKSKRSFYERGFTYEELTNELNQFIN
ncbi:MAG: TlpA disulfide reductase family protein [Bacteroidota bacterium]